MNTFTKDGQVFEAVLWDVDIESEQEIRDFIGDDASSIDMDGTDIVVIWFDDEYIVLQPFDWLIRNNERGYKRITDKQRNDEYDSESDFWVECAVCHNRLKNWSGSTPCCGSIAYMVEKDGSVGNTMSLFASINGGPIQPTQIKPE